jgi:hypothetical protein
MPQFPRVDLLLLSVAQNKEVIVPCAQIDFRDIALEHALVDDQMLEHVELPCPAVFRQLRRRHRRRE